MGFVADDQVPVGLLQLGLDVLVAAELVEAADDQRVFVEPVSGAGRFELVIGHDLEGKWNRRSSLVLPLLDQVPGAHNEAPLQVASGDQLLDQQPGHDGLAGAGIVGQQEAQRLAGQHLVVDGGDLVRQRVH